MNRETQREQAIERVVRGVRSALEFERRINLHRDKVRIEYLDDDTVLLDGEVESVAAKRLALQRAGAVPGPKGIVDRLRVSPSRKMGDGAVRDAVCHAVVGEPALSECAVVARDGRVSRAVREPAQGSPDAIEIAVDDGVVILNGRLGSLACKRLAGVLAWWVPGTRDVVNGIEVSPAQEDNDYEITDAIRQVLEKDRLVDADSVRVGTHDAVVTLEGVAVSDRQKEMAEADAWYVFGVNGVINRIEIRD